MNALSTLGTAAALLALAVARDSRAEEAKEAQEARGPIQDNMFLLEEAYNQEPGVIQHISLFQRNPSTGEWTYAFTEEWPARGQAHQASITLQVARVDAVPDPITGLGDLALNYRWQAVGSGETALAVCPRLSVLLPTGDWKKGLGTGGVGLQANLPVSLELGARFVSHFNVGLTWFPSVKAPGEDGSAVSANVGEGLVWLAHPNLNLLVEAAYLAERESFPGAEARTVHSLQLSPGLRGAVDFPFGLQVVAGAAVPFAFGPDHGQRSVLLNLSLEHPVTKNPW